MEQSALEKTKAALTAARRGATRIVVELGSRRSRRDIGDAERYARRQGWITDLEETFFGNKTLVLTREMGEKSQLKGRWWIF